MGAWRHNISKNSETTTKSTILMKSLFAKTAFIILYLSSSGFCSALQIPAVTRADSTAVDSGAIAASTADSASQPISLTSGDSDTSSWFEWDGKITFRDVVLLLSFLLSLGGFLWAFSRARRLEREKLEVLEEHQRKMAEFEIKQEKLKEAARQEALQESLLKTQNLDRQREKNRKIAAKEAEDEFEKQKQQRTAATVEKDYRNLIREKLGTIDLLGHEELDNIKVNLDDAFVTLHIDRHLRRPELNLSPEQLAELDLDSDGEMIIDTDNVDPAMLMRTAYKLGNRLLLIAGFPGSGKTTVMKFYAMSCLEPGRRSNLGLENDVMPLFLPLRDIELSGSNAAELVKNLAQWGTQCNEQITFNVLEQWLKNNDTLVLLDGLDEISDPDLRRVACRTIENFLIAYQRSKVVVTTRWSGYGKPVGVTFENDHMQAGVRDFSEEQQIDFLQNWQYAVLKRRERADGNLSSADEKRLRSEAESTMKPLVTFLNENEALRKLVEAPLLLQILVYLFERKYKPVSRASLYRAALRYLVSDRDRQRGIAAPLESDDIIEVLKPLALWMQQENQKDYVLKADLLERLTGPLSEFTPQPDTEAFCNFLHTRAGLFSDYQKKAYIFRHRSFMEYLAGVFIKETWQSDQQLAELAAEVGDTWWEGTLRFFMAEASAESFDKFITGYFALPEAQRDDHAKCRIVLQLVGEAKRKKTDALSAVLDNPVSDTQVRLAIDCLKMINSKQALGIVKTFAERFGADSGAAQEPFKVSSEMIRYAVNAVKESEFSASIDIEDSLGLESDRVGKEIWRNPLEYNAEYILIPGGTYRYSVSEREETVPDIYFAKYPLTFKRYRKFVRYLAGEEAELQKQLSREKFVSLIKEKTTKIERFPAYLPVDIGDWAATCRSTYNDEKRFNSDEQPVVRITWFDARMYCLWLTALSGESDKWIYDLPNEVEWEWAASGGSREYPWPTEKGKPTAELANYAHNVGATTPIGNYPDGATPEGLLDMAGNVWEWQQNWYEAYKEKYRSLRGGSWLVNNYYLRCSARDSFHPVGRDYSVGFRVVRRQAS